MCLSYTEKHTAQEVMVILLYSTFYVCRNVLLHSDDPIAILLFSEGVYHDDCDLASGDRRITQVRHQVRCRSLYCSLQEGADPS
jgi:hypothetical protein